jgi:hypothetical protein
MGQAIYTTMYINNYTEYFIVLSVHCAGLLEVHGASLYIVTVCAVGAASKLKVIHSVIT